MHNFTFTCKGTQTCTGQVIFEVEAETEEEARELLAAEPSKYYIDFYEQDSDTDWKASKPEDWTLDE